MAFGMRRTLGQEEEIKKRIDAVALEVSARKLLLGNKRTALDIHAVLPPLTEATFPLHDVAQALDIIRRPAVPVIDPNATVTTAWTGRRQGTGLTSAAGARVTDGSDGQRRFREWMSAEAEAANRLGNDARPPGRDSPCKEEPQTRNEGKGEARARSEQATASAAREEAQRNVCIANLWGDMRDTHESRDARRRRRPVSRIMIESHWAWSRLWRQVLVGKQNMFWQGASGVGKTELALEMYALLQRTFMQDAKMLRHRMTTEPELRKGVARHELPNDRDMCRRVAFITGASPICADYLRNVAMQRRLRWERRRDTQHTRLFGGVSLEERRHRNRVMRDQRQQQQQQQQQFAKPICLAAENDVATTTARRTDPADSPTLQLCPRGAEHEASAQSGKKRKPADGGGGDTKRESGGRQRGRGGAGSPGNDACDGSEAECSGTRVKVRVVEVGLDSVVSSGDDSNGGGDSNKSDTVAGGGGGGGQDDANTTKKCTVDSGRRVRSGRLFRDLDRRKINVKANRTRMLDTHLFASWNALLAHVEPAKLRFPNDVEQLAKLSLYAQPTSSSSSLLPSMSTSLPPNTVTELTFALEELLARPSVWPFLDARVWVVDDLECVSRQEFTVLNILCQLHRGQPGVPFGGIQLVAFGDLFKARSRDHHLFAAPEWPRVFAEANVASLGNPSLLDPMYTISPQTRDFIARFLPDARDTTSSFSSSSSSSSFMVPSPRTPLKLRSTSPLSLSVPTRSVSTTSTSKMSISFASSSSSSSSARRYLRSDVRNDATFANPPPSTHFKNPMWASAPSTNAAVDPRCTPLVSHRQPPQKCTPPPPSAPSRSAPPSSVTYLSSGATSTPSSAPPCAHFPTKTSASDDDRSTVRFTDEWLWYEANLDEEDARQTNAVLIVATAEEARHINRKRLERLPDRPIVYRSAFRHHYEPRRGVSTLSDAPRNTASRRNKQEEATEGGPSDDDDNADNEHNSGGNGSVTNRDGKKSVRGAARQLPVVPPHALAKLEWAAGNVTRACYVAADGLALVPGARVMLTRSIVRHNRVIYASAIGIVRESCDGLPLVQFTHHHQCVQIRPAPCAIDTSCGSSIVYQLPLVHAWALDVGFVAGLKIRRPYRVDARCLVAKPDYYVAVTRVKDSTRVVDAPFDSAPHELSTAFDGETVAYCARLPDCLAVARPAPFAAPSPSPPPPASPSSRPTSRSTASSPRPSSSRTFAVSPVSLALALPSFSGPGDDVVVRATDPLSSRPIRPTVAMLPRLDSPRLSASTAAISLPSPSSSTSTFLRSSFPATTSQSTSLRAPSSTTPPSPPSSHALSPLTPISRTASASTSSSATSCTHTFP